MTEKGELIPDPTTGLLQRRYTLVPGTVAFPSARSQRSASFQLEAAPVSSINFGGVQMEAPEKVKTKLVESEI